MSTWRVVGLTVGLTVFAVVGCANEGESDDSGSDAVTTELQTELPDLGGRMLSDLGEDGLLQTLHDAVGVQETIYRADATEPGTIIGQDPAPGTDLAVIDAWSLTVSEGGPVVAFGDLPLDVAELAASLPGFDMDEPLVERSTARGPAYKTDRWLFSTSCDSVDEAYRTFLDGRYDTACPGNIEIGPDQG